MLQWTISLTQCQPIRNDNPVSDSAFSTDSVTEPTLPDIIGGGYDFDNNGKLNAAKPQAYLYLRDSFPTVNFEISEDVKSIAIKNNNYLKRNIAPAIVKSSNILITNQQLRTVNQDLLTYTFSDVQQLSSHFDLYRIKGEDGKGNVHFTSYYIPIIKARKTPDSVYKYPIYAKPASWKGKLPSRKKIEKDLVLSGLGLELAYTADLFSNYMMQIQGSGYVQYEDGTIELLSFGGQNGYPYVSLGRYLVKQGHIPSSKISMSSIRQYINNNPDSLENLLWKNDSYVFFQRAKAEPVGAASIPLTRAHSIAVDKRYIPLGAVLLGRVPVVNQMGQLQRHEYRILFAQDVGGAIKGPGHVDLYHGIGEQGEKSANALHHYGHLWLLLPKSPQKSVEKLSPID